MANEKATVFISCGQVTAEEIALGTAIAEAVNSLTEHSGYLAGQVSELDALSSNILGALNQSVAFIAIMHHRGLVKTRHSELIRGSVWIEQEVAVAAFITQVLRRRLPVRMYVQKGLTLEGMRRQLLLNPVSFNHNDEVLNDFRTWLGTGVLRGVVAPVSANPEIRPNLQVDMTTEFNQQNNSAWLSGKIRNVGKGVASEVRLAMVSFEGKTTFAALVPSEPPKPFAFQLDNQPWLMNVPQFPGLMVQYVDDDGVKYEQQGRLTYDGPDASHRYRYYLGGLERPKQIPKFTLRYHPLEDL